jgi:predicted house-cleaning noncanonical NTP pyrophosphatase (MazG superfamily)
MPMTTYTGETEIITNLGTTPAERGLETDEFKAKFDEGLKAFVEWFNDTHKTEFDAVISDALKLKFRRMLGVKYNG